MSNSHPVQVYYVKKAISRVIEKGGDVVAMIDLHGHSAKQVMCDQALWGDWRVTCDV
jgi:hypothetical protein